MASYYRDKQRALAALHGLLDSAFSSKTNVNIPGLLYEFGRQYPVSTKAIRDQLELYADSHDLKIKGDELVMR